MPHIQQKIKTILGTAFLSCCAAYFDFNATCNMYGIAINISVLSYLAAQKSSGKYKEFFSLIHDSTDDAIIGIFAGAKSYEIASNYEAYKQSFLEAFNLN